MGNEFANAVDELCQTSQEKDIRCVVLTGEGKGFSAGTL